MSNSYVQIPPDSTGKLIRTQTVVIDGQTVHVHYMIPADSAGNALDLGTLDFLIRSSIQEAMASLKADTSKIPDEPAKEFGNLDKIKTYTAKLDVELSKVVAAIQTQGTRLQTWIVDGSAVIQPISVASLPLPREAANDVTLSQILGFSRDQEDHLKRIAKAFSDGAMVRNLYGVKSQEVAPITIGTTPKLIYSGARKAVYFQNVGTEAVFLGKSPGVTTAIYYNQLLPTSMVMDEITSDAWYGVSAGGDGSIAVMAIL